MKKLALVVLLGLSATACRAQVRVQTQARTEPIAEPAPSPAPEPPPAPEPQQGEQISLPEQIEFETDEARIKQTPKTLATLEELAGILKKHPGITKLRIEGHTDSRGKAKHNDKLSKARADAVAAWLAQHDVAPGRLVTFGFGSKRPLVANDTEAHRQQNRRTEYYVEEVDGKKVSPTQTVALAGANAPSGPGGARGSGAGGKSER